MGSDISSNYDSISPIFIAGFWRVHSAIHRTTGENTSLWVLDDQILANNCKNRADQEKYIASCMYSIQQIRKLHHPQILKISESNDNPKQLAFAAEAVNSCLINEVNLEPDEIEYIASQLSSVIFFLHHNAKIAHLNISPNSIVLTKGFSLKLCGFNYSCNITGDTMKVFPSFGEWTNSPYLPSINFSSPEMITNKTMTNSCDIYSFGCVIYSCYLKRQLFSFTTANEMIRTLTNGMLVHPESASEPMRQILSLCISIKPEKRPTIDDIENSEALNSLQLKVYKYIDNALTKSQAEKFNFFKSLLQSLSIFSPRMLRFKLFPLLMNETLSENRFGPVTIPLLFQIGALFDRREFLNIVYSPIRNLLTVTNPPEMNLSVFTVMRILIDRIDTEKHIELIYPIYNAAFQSNNQRLHETAVSYLPMLIKTLHTSTLKTTIIPKLIEFIQIAQGTNIVSNCISTFSECLSRIDHDTLAKLICPVLSETWLRFRTDDVGNAIMIFIDKCEPEVDTKMRFVVPLISVLLSDQVLDPISQIKLVNKAQAAFTQLVNIRQLNEFQSSIQKVDTQSIEKKQQPIGTIQQPPYTTTTTSNANYSIAADSQPMSKAASKFMKKQPPNQQTQQQQLNQLQQQLNQQQQQPKSPQQKQLKQQMQQITKTQQPPKQQPTQSVAVKSKSRPVVLPKQEVKQDIIPPPPSAPPPPPPPQQQRKMDFYDDDTNNENAKEDYSDEIDDAINDAILGERDRTKTTRTSTKYVPNRNLRHYNT